MSSQNTNTPRRSLVIAPALLLAGMAGTGTAVGQDASESALGTATSTGALEEVIITAQRRSESLQRVPLAVSAVTAETIENRGIRSINSIATLVPNLQLATPYGDAIPFFSLRGITTTDVGLNQSGPVALYVDEVYKGLPAITALQIFDVDRVEVLRGPQGTLYGKNTTGGAVNIYTRQPDVNAGWEGNVRLGVGNLSRFTADGGVNVPLIEDKLAARFAFTRTKVDGYVENLYPEQADQAGIDDWAARGTLRYQPTDTLDISLRYTQTDSSPSSYGPLAGEIGPGGIGFFTEYYRDGLDFFQNESDQPGILDITNKSVSLKVSWDVADSMALTSVTSYDDGNWVAQEDVDTSPYDIARFDSLSGVTALSQDLRLASSGDGALEWLVGAYYYEDKVRAGNTYRYYYSFAGDNDGSGVNDCLEDFFTGCRLENKFEQERRSYAIYTQNSYEFENRVKLSLGLRYTKDENSLGSYQAWLGYNDPTLPGEVERAFPTIEGPPVDELNDDSWSGRLGLSYDLSDQTMLYFSASRGYRGSAFNGTGFFSPDEVTTAEPEKVDAFEGGVKSELWGGRARVNVAAFHYVYKNQQFLDLTPEFLQILVNAPKSTLWGGELEATARVAEPLSLNIAIGYLNSEYDKIELSGQDLAGNTLMLAPEWTLSAGLDWTVYEGAIGTFELHFDSRYASKTYFDAFNSLTQQGYWIHDARLTYNAPSERFSIAVWGKNLANEEYRTQRYDLSTAFNFLYEEHGRPREYGLEVAYHF